MISNCLLCHNARCTEVCGKIEPGSIIRSLYFDNEDAVINRLDGNIPCLECDVDAKKHVLQM